MRIRDQLIWIYLNEVFLWKENIEVEPTAPGLRTTKYHVCHIGRLTLLKIISRSIQWYVSYFSIGYKDVIYDLFLFFWSEYDTKLFSQTVLTNILASLRGSQRSCATYRPHLTHFFLNDKYEKFTKCGILVLRFGSLAQGWWHHVCSIFHPGQNIISYVLLIGIISILAAFMDHKILCTAWR